MNKYKQGDRVIYLAEGPDYGDRGTVELVTGKHFSVRWDRDGETYNYEDWPGSSIDRVRRRR